MELGQLETPYESYTGQTYHVTFPVTVTDGGSFDTITGVLTVNTDQVTTYQLDPVTIKTLTSPGANNIFADTGDISVSYKADTKSYVDQHEGVTDVQVNGTSVVTDGVANVPIMSASNIGVAKVKENLGLYIGNDNDLRVQRADNIMVKAGTQEYRPITPYNQDRSVFYGLAKAAGNTDQSSSANAVGVYTDDAILKIQQMIGLWKPKCYLKYTQEEDANTTDTISFDQQDVSIEIYEELVIIVYQSDADNGQVIMSNDWGFINVRDAINSAYLTSNNAGYMRGNKPAVLKFKRYPGCVMGEVISGGATTFSTYAWVRSSDYLDKIRFIQMGCSGGVIKAGTTIEAYIHRFI